MPNSKPVIEMRKRRYKKFLIQTHRLARTLEWVGAGLNPALLESMNPSTQPAINSEKTLARKLEVVPTVSSVSGKQLLAPREFFQNNAIQKVMLPLAALSTGLLIQLSMRSRMGRVAISTGSVYLAFRTLRAQGFFNRLIEGKDLNRRTEDDQRNRNEDLRRRAGQSTRVSQLKTDSEPGNDKDVVDQASWESFPASDPPAW